MSARENYTIDDNFCIQLFDHNDLKTLESSTFGKLPSLLDLDLSYNKLERVRRGVLAGLSSIRDVRLDNNGLKVIPTPPISLTHMHLSHNQISSIKGKPSWRYGSSATLHAALNK